MRQTETMKRLLSKKHGQAFPLSAVGLFIMALSVVATLNLGQAIREKIMLQNTADAAAYSLAAMEARSFNFVALTNRTQIVNYNAAMAVQSYMNYANYSLFMVGTVKDLIACVTSSLDFGCSVFPIPVKIPYCILAKIFKVITMIASVVVMIARYAFELIHYIAPMAIEALGLFNEYMLWHTQLIRLVMLNAHIFSGMQAIIDDMYTPRGGDNRMKFMKGNSLGNIMINAALNTLEYRATFDAGSGLNPSLVDLIIGGLTGDLSNFKKRKKDANKDAVKIMTEMANASRSEKSIFDRSGFGFASWLVSNVWGDKQGATKLTVKDKPEPEVKKIHVKDNYIQGDYLSSDDFLDNGFGLATAGISIVLALPNTIGKIGSGIVAASEKNDRKHYGYKDNSRKAAHPLGSYNGLIAFPPLRTVAKKSQDKDMDCSGLKAHKWPG
ncbi:hypothetical protein KJ865_16490, partial [Myxococcota bacterium]|nr:hypothetical protein [Myxococcota bacterium]